MDDRQARADRVRRRHLGGGRGRGSGRRGGRGNRWMETVVEGAVGARSWVLIAMNDRVRSWIQGRRIVNYRLENGGRKKGRSSPASNDLSPSTGSPTSILASAPDATLLSSVPTLSSFFSDVGWLEEPSKAASSKNVRDSLTEDTPLGTMSGGKPS